MINISASDLLVGQEVWACAYDIDRVHGGQHTYLKQKPVKGVIVYNKCAKSFAPYNTKGKPIMSKSVTVNARCYCDTYKECVDLYNSLVNHKINEYMCAVHDMERDFMIQVDEEHYTNCGACGIDANGNKYMPKCLWLRDEEKCARIHRGCEHQKDVAK